MPLVIEALRQTLIGLERDEFELPHRTALGGGLSLVMPLFHRPTNSSVTKVLSLDADRDPFINGTVTWTAKGLASPIVADAVAVTTLRTGAITGVAVDALAAPDVRTLTIFGAGAQAFDQVRAVLAVRDIQAVTVVSRALARAEATAAIRANEFPGVRFHATTDGRASLREAEVIACATTSTEPLFSLADLHETALVTAIGSYRPGMHEFPQDLIASGCGIYVDSVEACMLESGELIEAVETQILRREAIIPLGRALLDGAAKGHRSIFKSVGIAPQDWAAMKVISEAMSGAAN
jgi:ornithine cyclodeaminase